MSEILALNLTGSISKIFNSKKEEDRANYFSQRPLYIRTDLQYITPPPISDAFVNNKQKIVNCNKK